MIATQLTKYGEVPLPEGIASRTISNNNGLDMHILVSRPDEQKRPLIILAHGFPELAYSWRHILPAIASLGYVVVAPDQRGYGQTTGWSNRFEDSIEPFNLVNLARDIVGLVGALGYHQAQTIICHDAGSYVAGTCALIRPDIFQSCVMMSAPFTGTPPLDQDSTSRLTRPSLLNFENQLNALKEPRKHYQVYYSTSSANGEMMNASQGLHQFIRAYYHHKSADWKDNQPVKLTSWNAEIMAQMPTYYIMNKNDSEAFDRLESYLKAKLKNENDRFDIEQLILLLHKEIMTPHSKHNLAYLVDQLEKKDELGIVMIHVDNNITVPGSAALQSGFVEVLFGLLVFALGPDYEGNFSLLDSDKKMLGQDTAYYALEKQFFTDLCSAELISNAKEMEGMPVFMSTFTLLLS